MLFTPLFPIVILPPPNLIVPPFVAASPALSPVFITLPVPFISTAPPLSAKAASPFIVAFPLTFIFVPCPSAKAPIFLYFSAVVAASVAAHSSLASIFPSIAISPELFTTPPTI